MTSLFKKFGIKQIFELWSKSDNLYDIYLQLIDYSKEIDINFYNELIKLKKGKLCLTKNDYEYIRFINNRKNWVSYIGKNQRQQRKRYKKLSQLSKNDLLLTLKNHEINNLSDLATHYLISPKHGRKFLRDLILKFQIPVNDKLYKSIYGISKDPLHWPKRYYEKRVEKKPLICSKCGFKAINERQIELHHSNQLNIGSKNKRNKVYYTTKNLIVLCANCHSLEHRSGEHLLNMCGQWRRKIPGNQKYKNPGDIFSSKCFESYRLQKVYYLKWYLKNSKDYKCSKCKVVYWGKDNEILSLELHHKDRSHVNSQIENLELLCPNCHRNE